MPLKNKKYLLTKLEQQLLNHLPDKAVVSLHSIRSIRVVNSHSLLTMLHRLGKKGFVIRLSRGRYYITKDRTYSRLAVGSNLTTNAYIGLESALFVYGAIKSVPLETYVVTDRKSASARSINNDRYILVPFGKLALGYSPMGDYRISSMGKTLFDCLYRIRYVDHVESLVDLVNLMGDNDLSDFLYFALKYGSTALLERAGYIISLSQGSRYGHAKKAIKIIESRIGKGVVTKLRQGSPFDTKQYVKRWHIYDNIGLENATRRL